MGCFLSIRRLLTRNPPSLTRDESPSKPFDSDSHSGNSHSPPESSFGLKSPIISIEPPSPSKSSSGGPAESIKAEKEPLDLPVNEMNEKIAALTSSIQDYETQTTEHGERSISDLDAILDIISENSFVYTQLEILRSHINSSYEEKQIVFLDHFQPVVEELHARWKDFLRLGEAEQREMARTQRRDSCLMRMFAILSNLRRACDNRRDSDIKIERKIGSQFDDVLGGLVDIGAQEAALKWRILEMVIGKRRGEGEARLDGILGYGIKVSGLLVGAIEALSEEEG
ncbi:hypothetical protein BGZ57DRAFT_858570 [Hyaloscypha finlandica]|nr:hypothetical protein BGZ57DRAFT_858570 [Hyaloscypha finlandica]